MKKLIKEYRVELVGLVVLLLAVFLLVNRNQAGAARWASAVFVRRLTVWFGNILDAIVNYIAGMSAVELVAWFMVVGAGVFIIWRIRYRFLHSTRWLARACPKCGSNLHRVHRTSLDRFLGSFLLPSSVRYRCSSDNCKWSGLRAQGPSGDRHKPAL